MLSQGDGERRYLGEPSHPKLFSTPPQSWLEAVTLESWEQVPVLPSLILLPEPFLPISYHVLLPQEAGGEEQRRVYTAQRGQSWEGPGQRPLPWGDQREIEPQTLWVHISAWEIQDDKSAEETGMGWGGWARGTESRVVRSKGLEGVQDVLKLGQGLHMGKRENMTGG